MLIQSKGFGRPWLLTILIAVGGLAYLLLVNSGSQPVGQQNIPEEIRDLLVPQPMALSPFAVVDQNNAAFTTENFKGKWSLVFFGYTNCPDVCPTTLAEMDDLVQLLAKNQSAPKNTQIVFVTLDPERDTAKELKEYLNYFNTDFIGLTGSIDSIREFSDPLGIQFSYVKYAPNEYAVNHSSAILLIDPKTRFFARFLAPHDASHLIDKYLKIVNLNL